MKLTLSWLRDHLDTSAGVDEIAERMTTLGLEVESIHSKGRDLAPFRIARVLAADPHPNADRLRVCRVDPGDGNIVQVVCGAPNAKAGMIGVFAPSGALIPGTGVELKAGIIRGQQSNGMLLSERELGLSDAHEGIIELPADAPIGESYALWAKLDDPMIDVAVTTNRSDCLGVAGVARDLAASGLGRMIDRPASPVSGTFPSPVKVRLDFGDSPSLCPQFALRLIRGVKNGPSPEWLQRRLRAIGLRPINALVDVTNFLTFDRNRPLHVFDAAKVRGDLVVRRARKGEELLALDGRSYALDESMCVIADESGVESLAGIMGGEASGCDEKTVDVLLESALWDPLNIAQTGRRLGINSDARYRFERGVDPSFLIEGLDLATKMILELCGGEASEAFNAGKAPGPSAAIDFPLSEVKRLAGIEPAPDEVIAILTRLGFEVAGKGASVRVTPPSWRGDVGGKADIVEEIVRVVGVDNIPVVPLPRAGTLAKPVLTRIQLLTRRAKRVLAGNGLIEAVSWSFISKSAAEAFGGGKAELMLANPISAEMSDMRPSLLPGLLAAAKRNTDRGIDDLALFEVGQIYRATRPQDQFIAASAIHRGAIGSPRHWQGAGEAVSLFDAKSDALALLSALGVATDRLQIIAGGPAHFHPGRSGTIQLGPQNILGAFGEFHPKTLAAMDVEGTFAGFEIILDTLPAPKARPTRTKPPLVLSEFQPLRRDFAFVVEKSVESQKIIRAALSADKKLIAAASVFDVFEGPSIGEGRKSVAIEVILQPSEKTLTEAEIEAISARIVAAVTAATGAMLRS